ncbi:MAG: hypothetical protein RTU30_03980 [Candidatus Thorarchaeota archaeon]
MRRPLIILLVCMFFSSALFIPVGVTSDSARLQETGESEPVIHIDDAPAILSESTSQNIRVAIYNEPNATAPDYATAAGSEHNNATGLRDILLEAGYQATLLDVHDIYNDALTVANFDAFILVDNFPRENITMKIKDFWMDGGGILSIDGSSGYLTYFGILPPEAMGTDGYIVYWDFISNDINITSMHPISQDFSVGEVIPTGSGFLCWNWTALQETAIADDLIRIGRSNPHPDTAAILAYDPSGGEGRIVTIAHDFNYEVLTAIDNMVPNAVEWISPSAPLEFEERTIRVAVYDEPDTSLPDYGSGIPSAELHYTGPAVAAMLTSFGYQVTLLDSQDIYNHQLMTADFDIFVIADSLPRDNITDMIREYWMGGGAIFAMDSSIDFLCYFEILGDHFGNFGNGTYFNYVGSDIIINARHPVTQAYQPGVTLDVYQDDYAAWNWTFLQEQYFTDDLTLLAHSVGNEDVATAVAYDPSDRGGKIVTLSYSFVYALPEIHQFMADAMDWLCPRPKGRILFDLSHYSYYPVDAWDDTGYSGSRYVSLRDDLVSSHYTFDKYYGGNFTAENLAPYDMLIINSPETVLFESEVVAVTDWVASGGGLAVWGDNTVFTQEDENINYLLSNFSLWINTAYNYATFDFVTTNIEVHPTTEGIGSLNFYGGCYLNYSGSAYPIIWDDSNLLVAGQEFGLGRVMLVGDVNFLDSDHIGNNDNHQFGLNIANWLTSCDADVLVYVDTAWHDPNTNVYRGPVAQALNDLGVPFQLTFSSVFFELSLCLKDWDLVIIDNINAGVTSAFDDLLGYLENGGQLIISTWLYSSSLGTALWDYVGFDYVGPNFSPPPDIHLWESDSLLLSSYGVESIITNADFDFGTECGNLTVYNNATALAGLSPSPSTTNATVVLGAGGRAIANGMLVTMYANDTDDSTYRDSFEIWRDEIGFLLFDPELSIDSPVNIEYEAGTTGHDIAWTPTSNDPGHFVVFIDGAEVDLGPWDGSPIVLDVNGLDVGIHTCEVFVSHSLGYTVTDIVEVVVTPEPTPTTTTHTTTSVTTTTPPSTTPTSTTPTSTTPTTSTTSTANTTTTTTPTGGGDGGTTIIIIIIAAAGGVVIIIIIIIMKKKSS